MKIRIERSFDKDYESFYRIKTGKSLNNCVLKICVNLCNLWIKRAVDKYRIDSHKLIYHIPRVNSWLNGENIYPKECLQITNLIRVNFCLDNEN